ncbi:BMC domain-containing protein [Anaerosporobacter faecicola]|uniref:BMC domain-containing protein n=1 Tax=Anaerosporobacter faecicola TaxID=2718714 RepID=UPI00143A544B|nr:BMC domain-containing protein [Anaerosporobacter faecicola]
MQALGLIEVVGYPPAVEAADAALKAANVTLLSIAKADAGIMTVEIIGDVGAVTSAVDAAARSAARIGLVRARHVIPRVEAELIGKVVPYEHTLDNQVKPVEKETTGINPGFSESKNTEQKDIEERKEERKEEERIQDNEKTEEFKYKEVENTERNNEPVKDEEVKVDREKTEQERIKEEKIEEKKEVQEKPLQGQELLSKRSNANLRNMIVSKGIPIPTERLKSMKKQELIQVLLAYEKEQGK